MVFDRREKLMADDFERSVTAARELRGMGKRGDASPVAASSWEFLARGKTLGKKVLVDFRTATSATRAQSSSLVILRIDPRGSGDDSVGHQVCLTLSPPECFPINTPIPADLTTGAGGSMDNVDAAQPAIKVEGYGFIGGSSCSNGTVLAAPNSTVMDFRFSNAIALLQWGVGDITNRAEVDMANGLSLNLICSWIAVRAMVEQAGQTTQSLLYNLGANIGPGNSKPNGGQRTVVVGGIANGGESPVFPVPRFARRAMLVASDGVGSVYVGTLSFWRSQDKEDAGAFFPVADYLFSSNVANAQWSPIPNGAQYFTVRGQYAPGVGGLVAPQYSVIFDLSI